MTVFLFLSNSLFLAAVNSQTDVKKNKTNSSKHKQKNLHTATKAPHHATTTLPPTPTPQPRATAVKGRLGPIVVPARKNDSIIVSKYNLMSSA